MQTLRSIDLQDVVPFHCQGVFDAVSWGTGRGELDAVILGTSSQRFISLGMYQDGNEELDLALRDRGDIPIVRRPIGGSAMFHGESDLLICMVFNRDLFPQSITRLARDVMRAIVNTYNSFGVDAHYQPVTGVAVRDVSIGRCAVGTVSGSVVLVSSIVVDSDREFGSRLLKMEQAPTSIREQTGKTPGTAELKGALLENLRSALSVQLRSSELLEEELAKVAEIEAGLSDSLHSGSVETRVARVLTKGAEAGVVVHQAMRVKRDGGHIGVTLAVANDKILDLAFTGDVVLHLDHVAGLERALLGVNPEWDSLMTAIENYYLSMQVDSPGTTPTDWVHAVAGAVETVPL